MYRIIAGLLFAFSFFISSYAAEKNDTLSSVIYFSDSSQAIDMVATGFQNIYDVRKKLLELRDFALDSANSAKSSGERLDLDRRFQENIVSFNAMVISQYPISIDNIFQKPTYIKYVSNGLTAGFNIENLNIASDLPTKLTKNYSFDCLKNLYHFQSQVESSLPKSDQFMELVKFMVSDENDDNMSQPNRFYIKDAEKNTDLLQGLINLRQSLDVLTNQMKNICQKATEASDAEINNLNQDYLMVRNQFKNQYDNTSLNFHLLFLNKNVLEFTLDKNSRTYHFPKLTLNKNSSQPLDILTANNAQVAIHKIDKMLNVIRNWTIKHS